MKKTVILAIITILVLASSILVYAACSFQPTDTVKGCNSYGAGGVYTEDCCKALCDKTVSPNNKGCGNAGQCPNDQYLVGMPCRLEQNGAYSCTCMCDSTTTTTTTTIGKRDCSSGKLTATDSCQNLPSGSNCWTYCERGVNKPCGYSQPNYCTVDNRICNPGCDESTTTTTLFDGNCVQRAAAPNGCSQYNNNPAECLSRCVDGTKRPCKMDGSNCVADTSNTCDFCIASIGDCKKDAKGVKDCGTLSVSECDDGCQVGGNGLHCKWSTAVSKCFSMHPSLGACVSNKCSLAKKCNYDATSKVSGPLNEGNCGTACTNFGNAGCKALASSDTSCAGYTQTAKKPSNGWPIISVDSGKCWCECAPQCPTTPQTNGKGQKDVKATNVKKNSIIALVLQTDDSVKAIIQLEDDTEIDLDDIPGFDPADPNSRIYMAGFDDYDPDFQELRMEYVMPLIYNEYTGKYESWGSSAELVPLSGATGSTDTEDECNCKPPPGVTGNGPIFGPEGESAPEFSNVGLIIAIALAATAMVLLYVKKKK